METRILCTGKIVSGEINWHISPMQEPPVEECAPDGTLDAMAQVACADLLWYEQPTPEEQADTDDYVEAQEDMAFWLRGSW